MFLPIACKLARHFQRHKQNQTKTTAYAVSTNAFSLSKHFNSLLTKSWKNIPFLLPKSKNIFMIYCNIALIEVFLSWKNFSVNAVYLLAPNSLGRYFCHWLSNSFIPSVKVYSRLISVRISSISCMALPLLLYYQKKEI